MLPERRNKSDDERGQKVGDEERDVFMQYKKNDQKVLFRRVAGVEASLLETRLESGARAGKEDDLVS